MNSRIVTAILVLGTWAVGCSRSSKLDCSTNPTKCEAGKTYDSAKAKECVEGYKAFSCPDFVGFMSGTTPAPSACIEGCK
jgi:hypothetical protein